MEVHSPCQPRGPGAFCPKIDVSVRGVRLTTCSPQRTRCRHRGNGRVMAYARHIRCTCRAPISHPNVCQVFELAERDGSLYIAMEYLEGMPLAQLCKREQFPHAADPLLAAGLAIQACEGLHHAHELRHPDGTPLGVVHRDV